MKLKLPILVIFISVFLQSFAQFPIGIDKVSDPQFGVSFVHKDKKGKIWLGLGSFINFPFKRNNKGLAVIDSGIYKSIVESGTFTGAIETEGSMVFSAFDGLHIYNEDTTIRYPLLYNSTCLTEFSDSIFVGSIGYGMYAFKDGHYRVQRIRIANRYYDTVNSVLADGDKLYIGTSSGLVLYESGKFSLVDIPLVENGNKKFQRIIISLAKDGLGRIWYSSGYEADSIPTLYVGDGEDFYSVAQAYGDECIERSLLPQKSGLLNVSKNGAILLGTWWGLLEFSDRMRGFITTGAQIGTDDLKFGDLANMAIEIEEGKYLVSNIKGIFEIDRSIYQLESHNGIVDGKYIRNNMNIDINDIDANMSNDGILFNSADIYRMMTGKSPLKLKSANCANASYSSAFWIGAYNVSDSTVNVAAQSYRQNGSDYIPGPININTLAYDSILSVSYNKIWKIDRETIEDFIANRTKQSYLIPKSILDWPANAPSNCHSEMAPYIDVDSDGKYDPKKGDYPKIKGDMMLWWVFNDLIEHKETKSNPLKVQINASCYAYKDIRLSPGDSDFLVNRTLLFDFKVINLGDLLFKDMYLGIQNDVDLGNYYDDNVGCDSTINAGYCFNMDNYDEGPAGFGANPPMIICKFLNRKMDHFYTYKNTSDPSNGNPAKPIDYYAYLQSSYHKNDSFYRTVRYQKNYYPCQNPVNSPLGDVRFIMSSKVDNLNPLQSVDLNFAYILMYDPDRDWLKEDCNKPKSSIQKVQKWYDDNSFPSKPYWPTDIESNDASSYSVYPNPTKTSLNFEMNSDNLKKIYIYDNTGRMLETYEVSGKTAVIQVGFLISGIYLIQIETDSGIYWEKIIKE